MMKPASLLHNQINPAMEAYPHNRMFNDIVFEGRNKLYGAYYLRHIHDRNMLIAMFFAIMITLLGVNAPTILRLIKGFFPQPVVEEIMIANVLTEPPPMTAYVPPPVETPKPQHAANHDQIAFVAPSVVNENDPVKEQAPPEIGDLENKTIGTTNVEGDPDNGEVSAVDTTASSGIISDELEITTPFAYVEQMPEFPGGEKMLIPYLRENLKYPVFARESGIEGRVVVQFVVSKEGMIQDAKVLKGIGGGCDQEALRVIRSMPLWKPGKHNGRVVPVTFTLPIVFDLK